MENAEEIWALIQDPKTYVYISGLSRLDEMIDKILMVFAGSEEVWRTTKAEMITNGRWSTLFYD